MPKIRLPLVLSLVFHLILFLGISSMTGLTGRDGQSLIVELVSFQMQELPPLDDRLPGPAAGPPQGHGRPGRSLGRISSLKNGPFRPEHRSGGVEEKAIAPAQQAETRVAPAAPAAPPGPALPSPRMEETMPPELPVRLGMGRDASGGGSDGTSFGGGEGAGGDPGGGGRPGLVMPSLAGRPHPKPHYPERARVEGREGTALLKVTILPDGKVGETSVERSSGHPDLDRSALEAVTKWKFLPARRGEAPVAASIRIPVTFALNDR